VVDEIRDKSDSEIVLFLNQNQGLLDEVTTCNFPFRLKAKKTF